MSATTSVDFLKASYNAVRAMGAKAINCDSYLEIDGHETLGVLIKQFPWPVLGPGGEIESGGPGGLGMWNPQVLKVNKQGQMVIYETVSGSVQRFLNDVVRDGDGIFQAVVYEGNPQKFHRAYKMVDCLFVPEDTERDVENRSQVTTISGMLFYHFFGEEIPGNILA